MDDDGDDPGISRLPDFFEVPSFSGLWLEVLCRTFPPELAAPLAFGISAGGSGGSLASLPDASARQYL